MRAALAVALFGIQVRHQYQLQLGVGVGVVSVRMDGGSGRLRRNRGGLGVAGAAWCLGGSILEASRALGASGARTENLTLI